MAKKTIRFTVPGFERPVTRWWAALPEHNIVIPEAHSVPLPETRRSARKPPSSILKPRSTAAPDSGSGNRLNINVRSVDFSKTSVDLDVHDLTKNDPDIVMLSWIKTRDRPTVDQHLKKNGYCGELKKRKLEDMYDGLYIKDARFSIEISKHMCMEEELAKELKTSRRNVEKKTPSMLQILVLELTNSGERLKVALASPAIPHSNQDIQDLIFRRVTSVRRRDALPTVIVGLTADDGRFWFSADKMKVVTEVPSVPSAASNVDHLPSPTIVHSAFQLISANPAVQSTKRGRPSDNDDATGEIMSS